MTSTRAQSASAAQIEARLREIGDPEHARFVAGYFRTGPGAYGEGDRFLGIRIPALRALVREYRGVSVDAAATLLRSAWHEARVFALLLLVDAYKRGDAETREAIYRLYLRSTKYINNWDLVDSSAPYIVGAHLVEADRSVLDRLARSESLWERRIAILATQHFIRQNDFSTTLRIAEMLVDDRHDLIHKAVGWMLREVGNRTMPRTMLRYAIEKFPPDLRQRYMRGEAGGE
jgi:3-methyladenine DNA glycosylase AlkD